MLTITVRGLGPAAAIIRNAPKRVERGVVRLVQRCRRTLIMWVQLIANEVSPPGYFPPVDRGRFEKAWKPENFSKGIILHNDAGIYSEVLEVGRRPGAKFPPQAPIEAWLRRHPHAIHLRKGGPQQGPGSRGTSYVEGASHFADEEGEVSGGPSKRRRIKILKGGRMKGRGGSANWMGFKQQAFLLARAIHLRGQKPRYVATNALTGLGDILEKALDREIDSILARIGGP